MAHPSALMALALAGALAAAAPVLAADDAEFVKEAASGAILEVELGTYAAEHASSPAVRAFRRRMAEDHRKAGAGLKELARSEGLSYPIAATSDHQRDVDRLMKRSGSEFDREYMELMAENHEDDLEDLREHAKGDSKVARWAARTVPTIEAHLTEARELREQVESPGEKPTARSSTPPGSASAAR